MSSSTTLQEAAVFQQHRAAHHGTAIQAALDSTPHSLDSLAILFQRITFSPERVFSLFSLPRQWVKQSCTRKCQRAKWNPLLIFYFKWQWICRWRKNWACAPFPRAKPFNQKKVECGRKGEDKRFDFKLKNLHISTQLTLDTNIHNSAATQRIFCFVISTIPTAEKAKLKECYQKGKEKKGTNFCM